MPLTVSIGVAALAGGDATELAFLERAVVALQLAKEAGRNRVVLAAPPP